MSGIEMPQSHPRRLSLLAPMIHCDERRSLPSSSWPALSRNDSKRPSNGLGRSRNNAMRLFGTGRAAFGVYTSGASHVDKTPSHLALMVNMNCWREPHHESPGRFRGTFPSAPGRHATFAGSVKGRHRELESFPGLFSRRNATSSDCR